MSTPFVSIIIPVYNDSERLKLCLRALERQTYPRDCFEIIVVDNGSDVPVEVGEFPLVHLVYEVQPGSYAARNRGLAAAKGTVLAFTDSDCLPDPDWLEAGVRCLLGDVGLVGGRVEVFPEDAANPTAVELYESLFAFQMRESIEQRHFSPTCNLFTTRQVFDAVGLFDARLKSGGDAEWGQRVHAQGYPLIYADSVCIRHPARRSFEEVARKDRRRVTGKMTRLKFERGRWLIFQKVFYNDFVPPVMIIWRILALKEWRMVNKLKVTGVLLALRGVRISEKLRLLFGGEAKAR